MHLLPTEQFVLVILQTTILIALVFRVALTGLFRVYPYFSGYLVVYLLQSLVLIPLMGSASYRYAWLVSEALLTFSCTLIILELYALIFWDMTGITSTYRRYLNIALGIAILISLLILSLEQAPNGIMSTFQIINRCIFTSLTIFMLRLTAFLVYYPVPLNRNVIVYSIGYIVYFTAKASGLLVFNFSHNWARQVDDVLMAASTVSMAFWLVALSRRGEKKTLVIGHKWNPKDHQKVLEQLKAINENLLRRHRKE